MSNIDLYAQNILFCNVADQPRNRHAVASQATALWRWMVKASQVHTQRRRLAGLSTTELQDIGISADEARREAARPFWDIS